MSAETSASPESNKKSIVVLPFINMSNDPDQEFFSDGLSEEILNALAQIRDLRVISRTSAFAFKGKDVSISDIATQLGVSHVLEGSVRTIGNDVRITAQLIEVETDSHLWSDAYSRSLENVFEIQEEISGAIAEQLQVRLSDDTGAARSTANLDAYQLFLRGRYLYQTRGQDNVERSVELLRKAVELDPEFADAWANLAAAGIVYGYGLDEGHKALYAEGLLAAQRAIEIDPGHGFGHAVLGLILLGQLDWERAMEEFDLAIELNPNESNSLLWKGIALHDLGYIDEAIAVFKQAEQVDPVFTNLLNWLARAYEANGQIDMLGAYNRKFAELDPDFGGGTHSLHQLHLGDIEAAEEIARRENLADLGSDLLVEAMYTAMKDPSKKDQSLAALLDNADIASSYTLFPFLWRIGALDEAISYYGEQVETGRGLRSANMLPSLWSAYERKHLDHPGLPAMFEDFGMADYWRKHGDPDYCHVEGDDIECGKR